MTLYDLINDSIRRQANNFQDWWWQNLPPHVVEHLKTYSPEDLLPTPPAAEKTADTAITKEADLPEGNGVHGTDEIADPLVQGEEHED